MTESSHWTLEPESLGAFLALLDDDVVTAGHKYEKLRNRLIRLFEWRGCGDATRLADHALNRVIRRVHEGLEVPADKVEGFASGVARYVHLEYLREVEKREPGKADAERSPFVRGQYSTTDARLRILERLLEDLPADERSLLLRYHGAGPGQIDARRRLADEMGITPGALRVRVHRLRQRLEARLSAADGPSATSGSSER